MGCFATCFPKSKSRKSLKPTPTTTPCLVQLLQREDQYLEFIRFTEIIEPKKNVNPIDELPLKQDEKREKLNISGRKKVTFDLNLKIYQPLPDEDEIQGDLLVNSSNGEEEGDKIEKEESKEEKERQCHSDSSSSSSSLFSFPRNGYRYQDCKDSDDEFDQLVSDDESDYDDCEDEDDNNEESSESLFSLSIESRKHKLSPVTGDDKEEVNSPAPVRMKNLDSVLQPVENKAQWKAIKERDKVASQKTAKENKISGQEFGIPISDEPIVKPHFHQGIAVDTSFSTWLLGSKAAGHNTSKASSGSVGNSPSMNLALFL